MTATAAIGTTMEAAATVAAAGSFATSIFMQAGLKPLIEAFKSLQLIIHVMLIEEYTFESQQAFFDTLLKIANFEIFEPDDFL